jgi:hypothetical protein
MQSSFSRSENKEQRTKNREQRTENEEQRTENEEFNDSGSWLSVLGASIDAV